MMPNNPYDDAADNGAGMLAQPKCDAPVSLRQHQSELEMQNEALRRAQAALDTASARYFDFYDLAPVGYATVSPQGLILQANLTTGRLLGLSRERLIGQALADFMALPDADLYHLLCQQALASGSAQTCELRLQQLDGAPLWVKLQGICATGDEGSTVIRLVLSDITGRKLLEQATLQASEDKFTQVADNTSDGIVIFGADRRIEYVSPAYVKQLGYSEAQERGRSTKTIYALVHPEDRAALFASIERAIEARQGELLYAYRVRHQLGHYIWREDHARFQYDAAGKYAGACVVARDISQRKQAEEELRVSELRYHELMAGLPIGVMLHGPATEILLSNPMALELLGMTQDQVAGKTMFDPGWDVIHEDGTPFTALMRPVTQAIASGQPVRQVVMGVFRPATQDRVWLQVDAIPQYQDDTGVLRVVSAFSDITERRRAEQAMRQLNDNLTQARQQLRRLAAFKETRLENEKRHIAREVHDELGQILTGLRMALSLAIIRHAGQVPGLLDELDDMKLLVDRAIQGVRNVATSLRPAALDMGLVQAIKWLCQEFGRHGSVCQFTTSDETIACDATRAVVLFRIVQESLNNISKYARASQVNVHLTRRGHELCLEVRDNGVGFDPEAVARRDTLGLLGMRERVLALGGRAEVRSAPRQGTVIEVVIPLDADVTGDNT